VDKGTCPLCGFTECQRDSVDIGVETMYGYWYCPSCGWSESSDYDLLEIDPSTQQET